MQEIIEKIRKAIVSRRYNYNIEKDLQEGLAQVLCDDGFDAVREVVFGKDRIDILVSCRTLKYTGKIAIEVKIKGSWKDLVAQALRYLSNPDIDALIVVGTRSWIHSIPLELCGKPVIAIRLIDSLL
jgi:hypothetical protein